MHLASMLAVVKPNSINRGRFNWRQASHGLKQFLALRKLAEKIALKTIDLIASFTSIVDGAVPSFYTYNFHTSAPSITHRKAQIFSCFGHAYDLYSRPFGWDTGA